MYLCNIMLLKLVKYYNTIICTYSLFSILFDKGPFCLSYHLPFLPNWLNHKSIKLYYSLKTKQKKIYIKNYLYDITIYKFIYHYC